MFEVEIIEISVTHIGLALILKSPDRPKVIPIFIGPVETYSISVALEKHRLDNPLVHDLIQNIIFSVGKTINKMVIDDFNAGTFSAKVYLQDKDQKNNEVIPLNARPSDAIALAIRFQIPILVATSVYEKTSISPNELETKLAKVLEMINKDNIDISEDMSFEQILNIKRINTNIFGTHESKVRVTTTEPHETKSYYSKIDVLNQMLAEAIKNENYERAAEIRDEIESFTKCKKTGDAK